MYHARLNDALDSVTKSFMYYIVSVNLKISSGVYEAVLMCRERELYFDRVVPLYLYFTEMSCLHHNFKTTCINKKHYQTMFREKEQNSACSFD